MTLSNDNLDVFFRNAYENLSTEMCCTILTELYNEFKISFSDAVWMCNLLNEWNCSEGFYYLGVRYLRVIEEIVSMEIVRTKAAGEHYKEQKRNMSLTDKVEDIICE